MASPSLSIFFPCYNDAGTIGSLVHAADAVASAYTPDYEIIVVDDGSRDSSREILRILQARFPRLKVVLHERNLGYGAALLSGFRESTKDLVFYTDGDGQYDVLEAQRLLEAMKPGIDVVNGYKIARHDSIYRVLIGGAYLWGMKLLFGFRVRDVDCDFRLIRREALQGLGLHHTSGVICLELVKKLEMAGRRFAEVPVSHYFRRYGRSQFFRPKHLVHTLCSLGGLWAELFIFRRGPRRTGP